MNRFILKIAKYQSDAKLSKALQHCTRQFMPPNADPMYSFLNTITGEGDLSKFPVKRRDGVAAVEVVISASREWEGFVLGSTGWKDFRAEALKYFAKRFGGLPMLSAVHEDESVPHVHNFYSPMALGTTAKAMVGGLKYRLMELQADFEREVASQFGLTYIRHSVPSHSSLRDFYATFDEQYEGEAWRSISRRELFRLQYLASLASEEQRREATAVAYEYKLNHAGDHDPDSPIGADQPEMPKP